MDQSLYQMLQNYANTGRQQIHQAPATPEDIHALHTALTMGMGSAGIENVGSKLGGALSEATQVAGPAEEAIQQANATESAMGKAAEDRDALDRFLGTAQTYGGIPPKPQMSIGPLKQIDNLAR